MLWLLKTLVHKHPDLTNDANVLINNLITFSLTLGTKKSERRITATLARLDEVFRQNAGFSVRHKGLLRGFAQNGINIKYEDIRCEWDTN